MASTRSDLQQAAGNLSESMGVRPVRQPEPQLCPVANLRDVGRRASSELGEIEIDRVFPDPDQPRTEFSESSIHQLAESMRRTGQLAPIHARWCVDTKKWVIVAGERRWRAATQAGLGVIKCVFCTDPLDPGEVLALQLIENLLRDDLRPTEEARGYRRLMELRGYTGKQAAEVLSIPESKISRALALLRLPDDLQRLVDAGELPSRTAYELSRIGGVDRQRRLATQAVTERLSHAEIAKKVCQQRGKARKSRGAVKLSFPTGRGWRVVVTGPPGSNYHQVEQALCHALDEVRARLDGGVTLF